jgi:hypothetical protein
MKNFSKSLTVFLAILAVLLVFGQEKAFCQFAWWDSLAITATPVDSPFVNSWQQVTIIFHRDDGLIKVADPDSSHWAARKYWYVPRDTYVDFKNVKRMQIRSVSGTAGVYFRGKKAVEKH